MGHEDDECRGVDFGVVKLVELVLDIGQGLGEALEVLLV